MRKLSFLTLLLVISGYIAPVFSQSQKPYNLEIESNSVSAYPDGCDSDTLVLSEKENKNDLCFIRFKSGFCKWDTTPNCTATVTMSIDALHGKDAVLSPEKGINGRCFPVSMALELSTESNSQIRTKESGLLCISSDEARAKFEGTVDKIIEDSDKTKLNIRNAQPLESAVLITRNSSGRISAARFGYSFKD